MKIGRLLLGCLVLLVVVYCFLFISTFGDSSKQLATEPTMTEQPAVTASAPTFTPTASASASASTFATCPVDGMRILDLPLKPGERNTWKITTLTPQQDEQGDIPLPPKDSTLSDPSPPESLTNGYTMKYHVAGPSAEDMVMVVGHSSPWRVLPFNSLMNQGKDGSEAPRLRAGQHVYLHTTCSGDVWLDYLVTETFTDGKPGHVAAGEPEFTSDPRIYGTQAMPGRLAVVTCLQPKDGSSTHVVVTIGQYTGLVTN